MSRDAQDLDMLWNSADPKAAEASYRALLPACEGFSGQDRCRLIELRALIARAEAAQGKFQDARLSLQDAERLIAEQQDDCRVSAKIRWLLETGRLHVLSRTPAQARTNFVQAWTLAINSGEDYLAVDVALMMSVIEPSKLQQQWIVKAIELAEGASEPRAKRWLGSLHISLGWKLYDLRQYEASLEAFRKASSWLESQGAGREAFVAKWSAGKVLRIMGRVDEALDIQNALLAGLGIGGARDGRLFEELAECLHALKRPDEAQTYFELAYRELSNDEWVTDNQPVALKRLKDLGKVK